MTKSIRDRTTEIMAQRYNRPARLSFEVAALCQALDERFPAEIADGPSWANVPPPPRSRSVTRTIGVDYGAEPGRVVGEPELCESCVALRAQARAENKAGFMLCEACSKRANPPASTPNHSPAIRVQAAQLMGAVLQHHDIPDDRQGEIQEAIMSVLEGRDE